MDIDMTSDQEGDRNDIEVGSAAHSRRMKDTEFQRRVQEMFDNAERLETVVMEAVGAAAKCWSEPPPGHFDRTKARIVGLELVEWINNRLRWQDARGD